MKLCIRFDRTKGMFCAFSPGLHPGLGEKPDPSLSEGLFFSSSPNYGQKIGPNLSEDLFFFLLALHLILG